MANPFVTSLMQTTPVSEEEQRDIFGFLASTPAQAAAPAPSGGITPALASSMTHAAPPAAPGGMATGLNATLGMDIAREPMPQPEATQAPAAPASAPPGLFGLTPPGPGKMMTVGSSTVRHTSPLNDERRKALDTLTGTGEAAKEAAGKRADVEKQRAEADVNFADELIRVQEEQQAEDRKLVENQNALIKKAESEYDAAVKERQGMKFSSLLSRMSTGKKALVAVLQAFGGLAGGMQGTGRNAATEALREAIKDDFEVQRQRIEDAKEKVLTARTGIADARQAKQAALSDLARDHQATLMKVKAMYQKSIAQTAGAAADAQAATEMAAIDRDIAQLRVQGLGPIVDDITRTTQRARVQQATTAGMDMIQNAQKLLTGERADPEAKSAYAASEKARQMLSLRQQLNDAIAKGNEFAKANVPRLVAQAINGGVLSDTEGEAIMGAAGGVFSRAGEKLSLFWSGTPSDDQLKRIGGTIDGMYDAAATRANTARSNVVGRLGQIIPAPVLDIVLPAAPQIGASAASGGATQGGRPFVHNGQKGTLMPDGTFIPG